LWCWCPPQLLADRGGEEELRFGLSAVAHGVSRPAVVVRRSCLVLRWRCLAGGWVLRSWCSLPFSLWWFLGGSSIPEIGGARRPARVGSFSPATCCGLLRRLVWTKR
jgi:hypothetical protein